LQQGIMNEIIIQELTEHTEFLNQELIESVNC